MELESEPCRENTLLIPFVKGARAAYDKVKGAIDTIIPTTSRNTFHITAKFGNKPISTLIDTGATHSFMRKEIAQNLTGTFQQRDRTVTLGDGASISATEEFTTAITIGEKKGRSLFPTLGYKGGVYHRHGLPRPPRRGDRLS